MSTERLDALLDKVEEICPGTKTKLLLDSLEIPWIEAVNRWFWERFGGLPWETKPLLRKRECFFCKQMMVKGEVAVQHYGYRIFAFHPDCFPKIVALEEMGVELREVIDKAVTEYRKRRFSHVT